MANGRRKHSKTLSAGRPPTAHKTKAVLSAAATRTLIRSHHRLHKELHKATTTGDATKAQALQQEIDKLGGLKSYQQASILGQSKDRGGDSSIVLMQWLQEAAMDIKSANYKPRLLEVGALSTSNACSKSNLFDIERIDLNSQEVGILRQDFMQRPLPKRESEHFEIISLSLVLNYVPDAMQRGDMLKRTCQFLKTKANATTFPLLFIVLPAPCTTNSRYLDDKRFQQIMESLGYRQVEYKQTSKLVYSLWHLVNTKSSARFGKVEVNPGPTRNNFTIVLETG
ncbi:hypothetical protein AMS68_003906 [Peltaster fructicola]|uniref:25S rRNA adenine-N(1) methyltransferase n=1 Tax=Peltaster fructicola TaxID=286661 RepID=A0A6H0XUT3_9PEZI|nr:hypothetical protein AMS68_003906 [Peltaster fructicola]